MADDGRGDRTQEEGEGQGRERPLSLTVWPYGPPNQ